MMWHDGTAKVLERRGSVQIERLMRNDNIPIMRQQGTGKSACLVYEGEVAATIAAGEGRLGCMPCNDWPAASSAVLAVQTCSATNKDGECVGRHKERPSPKNPLGAVMSKR